MKFVIVENIKASRVTHIQPINHNLQIFKSCVEKERKREKESAVARARKTWNYIMDALIWLLLRDSNTEQCNRYIGLNWCLSYLLKLRKCLRCIVSGLCCNSIITTTIITTNSFNIYHIWMSVLVGTVMILYTR